ncbi:hypothetical protein PROFUN_09040 [Planoprotostelium fungivorum]|uniref:Large ribosomal subunit protein mL52 n=1 Tax=Planoprotostelium fungivorum TaxID=1890364 RepID=A0A2P6MV35_9EUKA|nr:hypothetical protein PROFUN_09040 [Planoprotostelium fungivorum]
MSSLLRSALKPNFNFGKSNTRTFSSTTPKPAGQKWRLERGLDRSGNKRGTLRENPDFSYAADGKPGPVSAETLKMYRVDKREIERAQRLLKEMEEDIKIGNVQQFY